MQKSNFDLLIEEMRKDREYLRKDIEQREKDRAKIQEYMTDMKKNIEQQTTSITAFVKKLGGFIDVESKIIEEEINERMETHIKTSPQFAKYFVYKPDWKFLNEQTIDSTSGNEYKNNKQITEFDGLYIVSSTENKNFGSLIRSKHSNQARKVNSARQERFFIVVEGKHEMTNKRISHKLEKMKLFQKYIQESQNVTHVKSCTKQYQTNVEQYQLHTFSNKIYLYFGGPYVTDTVKTHLQEIYNEYSTIDIIINMMRPQGKRYVMYDFDETKKEFIKKNVSYTNKLTISSGI